MTVKQIGYVPVSIESRGLNGRRNCSEVSRCAFSSSEQTTRPPTPLNASAIEPARDTASRPNASSSVFGFELRPMVGEFTDAFCVSSATHLAGISK
jgi:hypothetical protein